MSIKIAVLDRGWIVVGEIGEENGLVTISGGAVVRYWGTTRGLGEIAAGGPTKATKLDPCPTVRVKTPVCLIDCNQEAWACLKDLK